MRVAIVGIGLIGGSAARDLRETGFARELVGVEADPAHAREAVARGLVDGIEELDAAAARADLVLLAVPVSAIERLLPRVLDHAGPGATVIDMGSTKERICRAVDAHPRRAQFVPAHPMAGTEHSGPAAAVSGLFTGKAAVICDGRRSGPEHLARAQALFRDALGMRLVAMGSAEHDLHAAYVSHLSHISSFVLANTVLELERDVATIFDLASGGFESTVRLAKSSPGMWGPIFEHNRDHVLAALDSYIRQLDEFRRVLAARDFAGAARLMGEANQIRRVLADLSTRGTATCATPAVQPGEPGGDSH
jgi:prephenate dehydrogenase